MDFLRGTCRARPTVISIRSSCKYRFKNMAMPIRHGERIAIKIDVDPGYRRNRLYGTAQPALLRAHRRARQHYPRLGASADCPAGADPPRATARGRAPRF